MLAWRETYKTNTIFFIDHNLLEEVLVKPLRQWLQGAVCGGVLSLEVGKFIVKKKIVASHTVGDVPYLTLSLHSLKERYSSVIISIAIELSYAYCVYDIMQ